MIKKIYCLLLIAVVLLVSSNADAARTRRDPFEKPQAGIWFGPVTPLYSMYDRVPTALAFGVYARVNTPWKPLKIGFDTSFQDYENKMYMDEVRLVPIYWSAIYRLPINSPLNFLLKAGTGTSWVRIKPDGRSQFDPLYMVGAEMSFPAGKYVNIGLRIDYLYLKEKKFTEYKENGNFVNIGLMLYFNIFLF